MPYFAAIFFCFWEAQSSPPPSGNLPILTDFVCNVGRMMHRHGG